MKKIGLSTLVILCSLLACNPAQKTEVTHYVSDEMAPLNMPFSDAVIVDNMIYTSGQVGNLPGEMNLVPGGMEAEAHQALKNIQSILEANGSSFDHAVKLTVMMADISEWGQFNEVYKQYFPGKKPARSALGTNGLALGARLEIECIAYIPKN